MVDRSRMGDVGGLRLWAAVSCVSALSFALLACASASPAQAPDATPMPTAEKRADATPAPTATPTESSYGDGGSEPSATATPSPSPTASSDGVGASEPATATTTEVAASGDPPLGDCFGGALSEDPLHCYVLEQARAAGLIDVAGIYEAPGVEHRRWGVHTDRPLLYVSVREGRLPAALFDYTREQSYAFYDRWPELVPFEKYGSLCDELYRNQPEEFPKCYLLGTGVLAETLLPRPSAYERVLLVTGGEEGRRKVRGWASWRQLWPRQAAQGGSGVRDASGGPAFDVSDVDMTNIPEIDESTCLRWESGKAGCSSHLRFPDVRIAGGHSHRELRMNYVQIKDPPTDPAEVKALKDRLMPCRDVIGRCDYIHPEHGRTVITWTDATSTIEIIPVKYDFAELWRWTTILNRFALSAGNTIGIWSALVGDNPKLPPGEAVYLNGIMPAGQFEPERKRETITVFTTADLRSVADALPVLLPLLGIPVDAVGMVEEYWQ